MDAETAAPPLLLRGIFSSLHPILVLEELTWWIVEDPCASRIMIPFVRPSHRPHDPHVSDSIGCSVSRGGLLK